MNKFSGFTLLEIVIGIALTSFLFVVLFNSFYQTYRTSTMVGDFAELDTVFSSVVQQLERDISSVTFIDQQKKKNDDKKAEKGIKKQFYATEDGKNFSLFTFITTNSLSSYRSVKPRLVRVIYRLLKNKGEKDYTLTRQEESEQLDLKLSEKNSEKQSRQLILAASVESCSFSFLKKTDTKNGSEGTIKKTTTWDSDVAQKKDGKKESEKQSPIAEWVRVEINIRDRSNKRTRSMSYTIPVYGYAAARDPYKDSKQQSNKAQKTQPRQGKKQQPVVTQGLFSHMFDTSKYATKKGRPLTTAKSGRSPLMSNKLKKGRRSLSQMVKGAQ